MCFRNTTDYVLTLCRKKLNNQTQHVLTARQPQVTRSHNSNPNPDSPSRIPEADEAEPRVTRHQGSNIHPCQPCTQHRAGGMDHTGPGGRCTFPFPRSCNLSSSGREMRGVSRLDTFLFFGLTSVMGIPGGWEGVNCMFLHRDMSECASA
jgi:hypothetical protein